MRAAGPLPGQATGPGPRPRAPDVPPTGPEGGGLSGSIGSGGTDDPDLGVAKSVGVVTGLCVSVKVAVCWDLRRYSRSVTANASRSRSPINGSGRESSTITAPPAERTRKSGNKPAPLAARAPDQQNQNG